MARSSSFNGANLTTTFVNSTTLKTGGYQGAATPGVFQVENPGTLWGAPLTVPFVASGPPPPQTISPTQATVKLGATQQFTSSGATSWTATAGTVSSSGLYTAPATMPASSTVTVTATGPGGSASATVTLAKRRTRRPSRRQRLAEPGRDPAVHFRRRDHLGRDVSARSLPPGSTPLPRRCLHRATDTVTATGPNGSATATVTLIPPAPVITGVGSNGQLPLGFSPRPITGTGFLPTFGREVERHGAGDHVSRAAR